MNLNNIDDIFEEGLAGYSEQPSKKPWNKISGKMLRYELFRLNLTNVPKLWVGFAAAGIVAVSLFIIDPFAVEPLENTTTINQKDSPAIQDNKPEESIFIPADVKALTEQEDISSFPSLVPGDVAATSQADETIVISEIETGGTFADQTQFENGDDIINQENVSIITTEELPIDKDALTTTNENIGDAGVTLQSTESADNTNTKTATAIAGAAVVENIPKATENSIQESNTTTKISLGETTQTSGRELKEDSEISQLNSRQATLTTTETNPGMNELRATGEPTHLISTPGRSEHESGKIQKMHSKSYSLGQFFKGKYKPPKRRFDENSASLYKGNKPFISVAAYFSPEFTEYARMASTSREISYIGGVALSYNKARFMIEGGLEYSHSNDLGDYMVDMQTYDSVGYYNEVGGFVPDPDNPGSVIFETNSVMVYDSVQHNLHQQTQNHYSYLQFPVMIGYQAVAHGLFSAYIKAGSSFSFLLNKQEQNLNFHNPDAIVNQIENYTPTRMNTSIQVLVSVRFRFQLSEKLGILAEPTYRYYLKSVYDTRDNSLENPYGIGVRCGLYFDL